MGYHIKEIFFGLQEEGFYAGRAALFCRFSASNALASKEAHLPKTKSLLSSADSVGTNGIGGGYYASDRALMEAIFEAIPKRCHHASAKYKPMIVLTGGEPATQVTTNLVTLMHKHNFYVAIETGGTMPIPSNLNWVCVCPKANTHLSLTSGDELRLEWPQENTKPIYYLEHAFRHFILQPKSDEYLQENLQACIAYCLANPAWRLGPQIHTCLEEKGEEEKEEA